MNNTLQVAVNIESFWSALGDPAYLGLIMRTCKRMRSECDAVFAVTAMNGRGAGKIKKLWAKCWLGLRDSWMVLVKTENLTLLMALKIVKQHGGVAKNYRKGIELRDKIASEKARLERREVAVRKALLFARYVPYMLWGNVCPERKRVLDDKLMADGLPCVGNYYNLCISMSPVPIDDHMVAEIRFRLFLTGNRDFENLVEHLVRRHGGYYFQIHAHARDEFRLQFVMDEHGNVGGRRDPNDDFQLENPEFDGFFSDDD